MLIRGVGVGDDDASRLAAHPTLREFTWYAEDVPLRVWQPFQAAVGKPEASVVHAREWFASRGGL